MSYRFDLGPGAPCDLNVLTDTRALIQANSGGGKSHTIRRLLEQTHGKIQQIVVDPEGEFSTLRERGDYVLAARQHGDTIVDPRSAKLLAEKLLQLGVSAILDIYELKAHERIRFVRFFLEALVDAPKELWHPALVVVDEAHVFCPQVGEAESAGAVIDLATRGRKRGYCAILATQRLSKLHKDAAAECNNKLIGRTGLDVDMKRAADELGLVGREEIHKLRTLEPGEFFAFGPAFGAGVKRIKVGPVKTSHPKAGSRIHVEPPPPTEKVKKLLPQLSDLPAEAEERAKTIDEARKEIAQLKRERTQLQKGVPVATKEKIVEKVVADPKLAALVGRMRAAVEEAMKFVIEVNAKDFFSKAGESVDQAAMQQAIERAVQQAVKLLDQRVASQVTEFEQFKKQGARILRRLQELLDDDRVKVAVTVKHQEAFAVSPAQRPPAASRNGHPTTDGLNRPQQRILDALAWLENVGLKDAERPQLGFLADASSRSSAFMNNLGALRTAGMIAYPREGVVALTEPGRAIANAPEEILTKEALQRAVLAKVTRPQGRILEAVIAAYPDSLTREEVGAAAEASTSSSAFMNNLGFLRGLGLIDYPASGQVKACPVLFLET